LNPTLNIKAILELLNQILLTKYKIRKLVKKKRMNLSKEELKSISAQIISRLHDEFYLKSKTINIFLPIERFNEINLSPLLNSKFLFKVGINKSNFVKSELTSYLYSDSRQIRVNKYGIPEPQYGSILKPIDFDLVLVPLLAFDDKGYRVGYGKGFYDHFLSQCSKRCHFIGVNHFSDAMQISDIANHDIPLDCVITPEKIIRF